MKSTQKILSLIILLSVVFFSACQKTDDEVEIIGGKTTVKGNITKDTVWNAKDTILLSGFVYVKAPAKLTIQAGTLIKGIAGSKATLIIEKGAQIIAQGTVDKPIVFTSEKPAGQRGYGDWGGIIICGNAKTNKHDNGTGIGIAEGGIGSVYGGDNDADNSGILQYVRIEFAGIPLTSTANSEINGLTLYSVGNATTIDHIQVSYSGDDSFEWFGGNVNCKYLVAFRGYDDDFDTDNGFSGNVQFGLVLRDPQKADQSQSNGFESDNDADGSTLTPITRPIFSNISIFGPLATAGTTIDPLFKNAIQIRRGSQLSIYNSIFAGYPNGLFIDGQKGNSPAMAASNDLQIENCILAGMVASYNATYFSTIEAYFTSTNPARSNSVLVNSTDLKITDAFNLTSPNFLPQAGSPVLSGAAFTNSRISGAFFEKVSYKGAFGTTNWTTGWCNFNPQNTKY